jgi:tRNA pseudouridine synthase 9
MGKEDIADAVAYHDEMVDAYNKRKAEKMTGETCSICDTPLYSDPGVHELGIYLHARRYRCEEGKWDYETGLPEWALPPPGYEGATEPTQESDPLAVDLAKLGIQDDGDAGDAKQKTPPGTSHAPEDVGAHQPIAAVAGA